MTGTSPGNDLALSVDRVSKRFCRDFRRSLRYGLRDIASELLGRRRPVKSLRTGEFWALRDVSLEVRRGEAVGLIGPNGAGKTTLLRLIGGLINPDGGSLTVRGRVAPLISLGVGFNPVLTGAENIFVIMTILGLTKKEIDRRFAEIVDFAEIGDALQAPVQTYSWGMTARLGFACAVHAAPDILVIDEVLAVGDTRFRVKCYRRLAAMRDAGAAFVLVSHNPLAILSVCDSATYLSAGRVLAQGPPRSVVARYEEEMAGNGAAIPDGAAAAARAVEGSGTRIESVAFRDPAGNALERLVSGEPAELWVRGRAERALEAVSVVVLVREATEGGALVFELQSRDDAGPMEIPMGEFVIRVKLPYCGLNAGLYSVQVSLMEGYFLWMLDQSPTRIFRVAGREGTSQWLFYQPRGWELLTGLDLPRAGKLDR